MIHKMAKFNFVSKEQFLDDTQNDYGLLAIEYYNNLKKPKRATKLSAGYDFYSPFDFVLNPGETIKIPTGIRVKIDEGWVLKIYPRSGLGFKFRLQLDNSVGIIDADYYNANNEGHIFIKITNDSNMDKIVNIKQGEAFAQGVFTIHGITIDDYDDIKIERIGGIGSTSI